MNQLRGPDRLTTAGEGRSWWPTALVVALAVQAALVLAMVTISSRDPSFAVEADYYGEAVRWDEHAAARDASNALGWSGALELSPRAPGGERAVVLVLTNRYGDAVVGAQPRIVAFHQARAADRTLIELTPLEGRRGTYSAPAPLEREGLWELRLEARRGADTFLARYQLTVGAGSALGRAEEAR
jgi:nitrogen fixation protein FixH